MSELVLPEHLKPTDTQPSTNFNAWKKESGVLNPSAEQAWVAQTMYVQQLEKKLVEAMGIIKRSNTALTDLKKMFEENLQIMADLELENLQLKGAIPKDL